MQDIVRVRIRRWPRVGPCFSSTWSFDWDQTGGLPSHFYNLRRRAIVGSAFSQTANLSLKRLLISKQALLTALPCKRGRRSCAVLWPLGGGVRAVVCRRSLFFAPIFDRSAEPHFLSISLQSLRAETKSRPDSLSPF